MKKKIPGIVLFVFLVLQFGSVGPAATVTAAERDLEYKLKAAFLLNFAKFTTWPVGISRQNFTLCVLGEDPFGAAFTGIESKTIAGKPIELVLTRDITQTGKCQLVYVSASEGGQLDRILQAFNGRPVLMVSDIDAFAADGGIIEFVTQDRLGFIINLTQAKRAGLKINASLLNLAAKVL